MYLKQKHISTSLLANRKKRILIFILLFSQFITIAQEFKPIHLKETDKDLFVHTDHIKFFIDSNSAIKENNLFDFLDKFRVSEVRNLTNDETDQKYWLYFKIINDSKIQNHIIELYDFNIDDVSVLIIKNKKKWLENHSGYNSPFTNRSLDHKNYCYPFSLNNKDTLEVFMGLKSGKKSILKPVIKTHKSHTKYILQEYYLLGIFYGILLLIASYNLIYFFILKENTYLYYVTYLFFMCLFFLSQDGLGFQYIWFNIPKVNEHIETLSLSLATVSIFWFTKEFLSLNQEKSRLTYVVISLVIIAFLIDIFFIKLAIFRVILFLCFQVCFGLGVIDTKKNQANNRWFIISFLTLNLFYLIGLLEKLDLIPSGVLTVYSFNLGIVLQFILLSIGIAENSKSHLLEKNRVLNELLSTKKENDALRLIELKRQMNPHFLFNALNSIQSRILVNNSEDASTLLLKFSQLLRKNLEISDAQFINFSQEISLIINYLEIEKIRLGGHFEYEIDVDPLIKVDVEQIPTFLIQPLVENAIWHGFSKKKENQFISITFKKNKDNIEISIYDNGIGMPLNTLKNDSHNSKGLSIVKERLALLERTFGKKITLEHISPFKETETGTLAKITQWK